LKAVLLIAIVLGLSSVTVAELTGKLSKVLPDFKVYVLSIEKYKFVEAGETKAKTLALVKEFDVFV